MSINVTVRGNPISIKHGKMVCADSGSSSNEFQRRRLMRLEQVRQQSKNIAENVRNKVRKEQNKGLSEVEKQGAKDLKKWQVRKLLTLEKQYCECLKDIGLGHSQAQETDSDEPVVDTEKVQERGRKAARKLHKDQERKEAQATVSKGVKTRTKNVEQARSALVSNYKQIKKKKKAKKISADINISSVIEPDSPESESDVPELVGISSRKSSRRSPQERSPPSSPRRQSPEIKKQSKPASPRNYEVELKVPSSSDEYYPRDTRISERIKHRREKRYWGPEISTESISNCQIKSNYPIVCSEGILQDSEFSEVRFCDDIPSKPTVSLRAVQESQASRRTRHSDGSKVQYYDHSHRFSKSYVPDHSQVDKVQDESICVCPSAGSEAEFQERMYKHDVQAQQRGQKALEREKVHRDYKDMMNRLPILQRNERIASINTHKPLFHMSDERLREREASRQLEMENAYEKIKPTLITIPPKNHQQPVTNGALFQTVDSQDKPVLNVGCWDCDMLCTSNEASDDHEVKRMMQRKENLRVVMEKLKSQKEQLMNEASALPENSNFYRLIDEVNATEIELSNTNFTNPPKHSASSSENEASKRASKKVKRSPKKKSKPKLKRPAERPRSSDSDVAPSPKQKPKILQNTSTQTTPKPQEETTRCQEVQTVEKPPQPHVCVHQEAPPPHVCSTRKPCEKVCEIVIKIHEEAKPKPKKVKVEEVKEIDNGHLSSWKEYLKQNSNGTTSTSYYSLPDLEKPAPKVKERTGFYTELLDRKKQENRPNLAKKRSNDPNLRAFVQKLLSMSRGSINDLGVSTASEITTPSPSVVEADANDPLIQLHNIMNRFQINASDIEQYLNYSSDDTPPPYNTGESLSVSSSRKSSPQDSCKSYPKMITKYTELADSCSKRITNLTEMIEKVREEKIKILQSSNGTKDESTVYLDPPNVKKPKADESTRYLDLPSLKGSESSSPTADQEELNRQLMEIDVSLAEKLKKISPAEFQAQESVKHVRISDGIESRELTEVDRTLHERFRRIISPDEVVAQAQATTVEETDSNQFVPFLLDIPRLPKFTPNQDPRARPPPSKGLTAARRFNNGILNVPHELSTIAEADSHTRSNLEPNEFDKDLKTMIMLPQVKTKETKVKKKSPQKKADRSSSDGSSGELEAMLHSLGMSWAVATLRKTQEALALTSSSSSLDLSIRQKEFKYSQTNGNNEFSVTEFFGKESVSTSTETSGSLLRELEDASGVNTSSQEKKGRHTSTPIREKNSSDLKGKFDQSELSSVRSNSEPSSGSRS